jgi:hypothetical protein
MIGTGGVGFRPNMLPGLAYWLRADIGVTLETSTTNIASIANQGYVRGNDPNNFGNWPTIAPNVNQGLPGIVCNGNSTLTFPSNVTGNTGTAFLVLAAIGTNGGGSYSAAWAFDGPAMYLGDGGGGGALVNTYEIFDGAGFHSSGHVIPNSPTLLGLEATSAPLISMRFNGGTPVTSATAFANARGGSQFGSDAPGLSNGSDCTIQEFLFFTTNLTTIQRKWVERYLAVRYGLTVTP